MMGDLIKINKSIQPDSKKSENVKALESVSEGQILMFTGIRYERQTDSNKGDNHPNKKHKRG